MSELSVIVPATSGRFIDSSDDNKKELFTFFPNHNTTFSEDVRSWSDLLEMLKKPSRVEKSRAPCIAPHTSSVKKKNGVKDHNRMTLLWADIDTNNLSLHEVKNRVVSIGIKNFAIYSTSSSMRLNPKSDTVNGKRWRVVIRLIKPIAVDSWVLIQAALVNLLKADTCGTKIAQILYAPNNLKITDERETQHYEYYTESGSRIDADDLPIPILLEVKKIEAEIQTGKEQTQNIKLKKEAILHGQISVIDAYNATFSIEMMLGMRGDEDFGYKWKYRASSSSPGIYVNDEKMYSHHTSDPLSDGYAHDAFDVFASMNGLSVPEAIYKAARMIRPPECHGLTVHEYNVKVENSCIRKAFTGALEELATDISKQVDRIIPNISNLIKWKNFKNSYDKVFIDSSKNKVLAINSAGDLPMFTTANFMKTIRPEMFGVLISYNDVLEKAAEIESDETKSTLMALSVTEIISSKYENHLKIYRQRSSIYYKTDMFSIEPKLVIEAEQVCLTCVHKPFPVCIDKIEEDIIDDYLEHFPELPEFLDLLTASRFACDRKKAFFWLKATSDWGKGFLTSSLKKLGILTELSVKEIESALAGSPIGKQPKDFKGSWILHVDEFKKITSEVKQLTSVIQGSPKNQMNFEAEVYMKLFSSAEEVDSLAGSGVEEQFSNRFSLIPTKNSSLEARPVFKSKGKFSYIETVTIFIANGINQRVDTYLELGRKGSADKADGVLDAYNKQHRLSKYYGSLDDVAKEIADELREIILKLAETDFNMTSDYIPHRVEFNICRNTEKVIYRNNEYALVKNSSVIISEHIKNIMSPSEQKKVGFKSSMIAELLDDSGGNINAPKSVLKDGEKSPKQRRGLLVNLDVR